MIMTISKSISNMFVNIQIHFSEVSHLENEIKKERIICIFFISISNMFVNIQIHLPQVSHLENEIRKERIICIFFIHSI